jgi:hypothetical protein
MQHPGGLLSCAAWGVSVEWTDEEQRALESCLMRFPADRMDSLQRYVRAAAALPRKSVRDVALRARWTALQHQLKKRTAIEPMRKPGMPPMPPKPPAMPLPGGAPPPGAPPPAFLAPPGAAGPGPGLGLHEGPPALEGPAAALLDSNLSILNHFRANMSAFKVHENTQLLVQFRDNILAIINAMEAMGGVMAQMPPLPVRLNVDLANNFLPSRPSGLMSYDGMLPPPPQPAPQPGMVPVSLSGFAPGAAPGLARHHHLHHHPHHLPLPPPPLPLPGPGPGPPTTMVHPGGHPGGHAYGAAAAEPVAGAGDPGAGGRPDARAGGVAGGPPDPDPSRDGGGAELIRGA